MTTIDKPNKKRLSIVENFEEENKSLNKNNDLINEIANPIYRIPIFLSYANPFTDLQTVFLNRLLQEIMNNLLFPRTLGVTDLGPQTPLTEIRRIIMSSFGLLGVAFRRVLIVEAISRPGTPRAQTYTNQWLSSPYLQIEPAMAYEEGLPIMIIREQGVINDGVLGGILEQGAAPLFIPEFSTESQQTIDAFFNSVAWKATFAAWVGNVREYYEFKTQPLFESKC